MSKPTKKTQAIEGRILPSTIYSIDDALVLVKEFATAKFKESVDVAINLGIDPKKSDQVVRGSTILPNGSGKTVRIAVFAQGENAEKATAAGADLVGFEDLAENIKGGSIDFDILIATPDAMRLVGQLGKVLGPRGLMPNPKAGTVTTDIELAVKNAKSGQVSFRADKAGIIHCSIGLADFDASLLKENLVAIVNDLNKAKPSSAKGLYMKKLTISSTMGPGVVVDQSTITI